MHKQEASLRNWRFEGPVLIGNVYGHPRFPNGHKIHTSRIVNFNKRSGIVETLHTFYRLEDYNEPEEPYESSKL